MYINRVSEIKKYFNQHQKAMVLLLEKESKSSVTRDCLCCLNTTFQLAGNQDSRAMLDYIVLNETVTAVTEDIQISNRDITFMSPEMRNTLAAFITVLAEVCRIARKLEAGETVTVSCAPCLLLELYKSVRVRSSTMNNTLNLFFDESASVSQLHLVVPGLGLDNAR